jgi:hypothetical protein
MPRTPRFWGAAFVFLALASGGRADTYYVVVFGAQSKPQRPKYSHSWATFVHVCGADACGPPAPGATIETFTISWLPCKIELTPNRLRPEPGRNFDLSTTFDIVLSECEQVTAFGPYQTDCWLYNKAMEYVRELESGDVRYKTIDVGYQPLKVSNCIHALTSFDREHPRVRIGRTNFGEVASYYVTETYTAHMPCPKQVQCWVADFLGLGRYPIKWRTLEEGRPRPSRED